MYGCLSGIIFVKRRLHAQLARHGAEQDRDQDEEDQQRLAVAEDPERNLADPVRRELLLL